MASVPHGADANGKWIAAVTAPDICVVGGTPTPFDTSALLSNWDPANPETRIRALNHRVYRLDDKVLGVLGNAGAGQVSGVSLGTGYVTIGPPSPPTRVIAAHKPVVVDRTPARLNTDKNGGGGTPGNLYTDIASVTGKADTAGDVADALEKGADVAVSRAAPRGTNGRFMSRADWDALPVRQQITAGTSVARPGMSGTRALIGRTGKVLGPVGNVITAADGAANQLAADAARTDLTDLQKGGRAATRSTTKVAGSVGGAIAGAKAGAAIGVWFGPWGVVIGGAIGAVGGSLAGDWVGDKAADAILDQPFAGGRPP